MDVVRQLTQKDAYSAFEYALKAPETKRQWPRRLDVFLAYLQLDGNGVKKWDKIELYWDSLISKPELQ
jgi:hypothetical protein